MPNPSLTNMRSAPARFPLRWYDVLFNLDDIGWRILHDQEKINPWLLAQRGRLPRVRGKPRIRASEMADFLDWCGCDNRDLVMFGLLVESEPYGPLLFSEDYFQGILTWIANTPPYSSAPAISDAGIRKIDMGRLGNSFRYMPDYYQMKSMLARGARLFRDAEGNLHNRIVYGSVDDVTLEEKGIDNE